MPKRKRNIKRKSNKKTYNNTFVKLLVSSTLTFVFITAYNHDSMNAVNEFDPNTIFRDFTSDVDIESYEEIKQVSYEKNIASKFSFKLKGTASYYADKFHGRLTANGERFNMNDYSAAHKSLPFGTILKVTNIKNNKSTLVRINDRGPYVGNRIIDLSKKAAHDIDGLGLSFIRAEGFENSNNTLKNLEDDYLFGYSYNNELLTVKASSVKKIDSNIVFGQAVRMYNLALQHEENLYLFVDAKKQNRMETPHNDYYYYIGTLKENIVSKPSDIVSK